MSVEERLRSCVEWPKVVPINGWLLDAWVTRWDNLARQPPREHLVTRGQPIYEKGAAPTPWFTRPEDLLASIKYHLKTYGGVPLPFEDALSMTVGFLIREPDFRHDWMLPLRYARGPWQKAFATPRDRWMQAMIFQPSGPPSSRMHDLLTISHPAP